MIPVVNLLFEKLRVVQGHPWQNAVCRKSHEPINSQVVVDVYEKVRLSGYVFNCYTHASAAFT